MRRKGRWRGRYGFVLAAAGVLACGLRAQTPGAAPVVLHAEEAAHLMPPSVFFQGQTAPTQGRNTTGLKLSDGTYVLAALVDNSGYSSGVREKYQGYLITEAPLQFAGHTVAPGAYGFGFVAQHRFVLMDVGGHEIAGAASERSEMRRPMPLQIVQGAKGGEQLCSGRECVAFETGP